MLVLVAQIFSGCIPCPLDVDVSISLAAVFMGSVLSLCSTLLRVLHTRMSLLGIVIYVGKVPFAHVDRFVI